ncbi:MAG: rhamnogalacturonan acetylesterase [Bacteroidota bacterium]|nr:rhamnogalacturonan acetylesterase [Bacteroidota bacterium]
MRLFLIVISFFTTHFSQAQILERVKCFEGEKNDFVTSLDTVSTSSFLMNIRSASYTHEFTRNANAADSFNLFSNNWLLLMNSGGDTIWKRMIANTQDAYYVHYFPGVLGQIPFPSFDYNYSIYTRAGNEILLSYTYIDSLEKISSGNLVQRNFMIDFGILNIDGTYKTIPFHVDTIQTDSNITTNSMSSIKLNDSIYQFVFQYAITQMYVFEPVGTTYTAVYTVNVNRKTVSKNIIAGGYLSVLNSGSSFYIEQGYYDISDTAYYFAKITNSGNVVPLSFSIAGKRPQLYLHKWLPDGKIFLGGYLSDSGSSDASHVVWYIINSSDMSFTLHEMHSISGAEDANGLITYGYSDVNFPFMNSPNDDPHLPYLFYRETFSMGSQENKYYLMKLNLESGDTLWMKPSEDLEGARNLSDGFFLNPDSSYFAGFGLRHSNRITKIDTSGITMWNTALPDTVIIDSALYFPASSITYYYTVNYNDKFIVNVSYMDTINPYYAKPMYFFVSSSIGEVSRISAMDEHINFTRNGNLPVAFYFLNMQDNALTLISQESNLCLSDSSEADIAIYKLRENIISVRNTVAEENSFTLFPNPSSSTLNLKLNETEFKNASYILYDISGKIIGRNKIRDKETTIDVSSFPTGLYLLNIQNDKTSETKKFQVIH